MSQDFDKDARDSSIAFDALVRCKLADLLGGSVLRTSFVDHPMGITVPVGTILDINSGIDALHTLPIKARNGRYVKYVRGVAYRVQFKTRYDTFTLRRSRASTGALTEWDKLLMAQKLGPQGWLAPMLHVHAYVSARDSGRLLSLAVVYTMDLVDFILRTGDSDTTRKGCAYVRTNGDDGNTFWVATWDDLRSDGARMRSWVAAEIP